ncbi:charged multivesicular body protein 6-A-like [Diorhabda carinulata]|uniref:charged multivesicular body protein 6-A-like n=1 Tax=Diorhabda carinulata TaxID=1163345 RepID=UPI0025A12648|nr:charged multivesicular body protein 6-A-like [Diorhabda carinulata]
MGTICSKKTRVTQQDRAILKLKQQRDALKQYHRTIERSINKDLEVAKKLLTNGHRERAKLIIKKKRFQEQLMFKLDKILNNIEQILNDMEFVQIENQVVEGLKIANETLKKINAALDIKNIETILDDTKEGADKQKIITELISGYFTEEDEAAIEEELIDMLEEDLPNVPLDEPEIVSNNVKVKHKSSRNKGEMELTK